MMEMFLTFLKSNFVKRFLWQTFAGFLGLAIVFLGSVDWVYAPLVIALLGGITKELNNKYGGITE